MFEKEKILVDDKLNLVKFDHFQFNELNERNKLSNSSTWLWKSSQLKRVEEDRSETFDEIENLSSNDWPNINSIDLIDPVFSLFTPNRIGSSFFDFKWSDLVVRNRVDSKLLGETFFIHRQCEKFSFKWFFVFVFSNLKFELKHRFRDSLLGLVSENHWSNDRKCVSRWIVSL